MDYEQEYEEYSQQHMSRGRLVTGQILKWTGRVLVWGIIALVLWRVMFSGRIPKSMTTLTVNDAVMEAYEAGKLDVYTQDLAPVNMDGETAGYFWVCQAVFIPEINQVQILVRYNNSTLKHIAEDFGLGEGNVPARDEDVIDVTLAVWIDPDPTNDTTTDRELVRIQPTGEETTGQTSMYNYRRYVFDGVDMEELFDSEASTNVINMTVDIYYQGSVNYDRAPYSTIVIYEPRYENLPYDLTGRDKRALKAYSSKGE
jgi:hypothetical protein